MTINHTLPPLVFNKRGFRQEQLVHLYEALALPRLIEEKMLKLLRQGQVSKWFSGIGQEAIAVGVTSALESTDTVFPLHRNLGVFTTRHMPLRKLFAQWQGKAEGYTQGRDRSFHFGSQEHKTVGMISHLGAMLGVADGVALAHTLKQQARVVVAFSGDGGTSEGDFHEAVNTAAVWDLPVIFLIENNGYGLSTPSSEQFRCASFTDKAIGYGIQGIRVDGNNVLDVYRAVKSITAHMREKPAPVILEAITFRMRGHEEASGTKYVPQQLFDLWKAKDPVENFERYLLAQKILTPKDVARIQQQHKQAIEQAWEEVFALPEITHHPAYELNSVYAPPTHTPVSPNLNHTQSMRFVDALSLGLKQCMTQDPHLVIMGQDIAEYGGVFKVTDGFVHTFGKHRVRNTPLCESAILGASLGLAIEGIPSVVEMQFADFVSCGFNQIANNLAKTHYRWGQQVPVTIRMPTGGGTGAGPFHSQSNEAWFTKIPGLKVLYPSTPEDAKGLLASAIADPNPVMFFEHKWLYRKVEGLVPLDFFHTPIGKARVVQEGSDLTVVTYGASVYWALEAAQHLPDASIEIIDLRSLLPWDTETVCASVQKTNRCLVVHEDTLVCGFGAEIAAYISEHMFEHLDAPVTRMGSLETPIPFHPTLEQGFFCKSHIAEKIMQLLAF
jgi:2-oxoisovalerate dehydrogenase E1 component